MRLRLESPEVVIIGGGPAGTTCALGLARLGRRVVLIERGEGRRGERRVGEACSPRVRRMVEAVAEMRMPASLYCSLSALGSAWGSGEVDERAFRFWEAENGLVLDRFGFDSWLRDAAVAAGVDVRCGWHVLQCLPGGLSSDEGWLLTVARGEIEETFPAAFVVEATGPGSRSVVYKDAGRVFADWLVCLWGWLPARQDGRSIAAVEACPSGWWYTAPLPDGQRVAAYFTDADLCGTGERRRATFLRALNSTGLVRSFFDVSEAQMAEIRVAAARTSARRLLWRGRWLVVGDAAWCVDPLSGSGVERAITDGLAAATAIARALSDNDPAPLRAHATARAQAFQQALRLQRTYYAAETRWRDERFWRRRQL